MKPNGFSLVELITVIAIAVSLMAISSLYFRDMNNKNRIERQTKELYADLMSVRTQALYQKTPRNVTLSSTIYIISPWQQDAGSATVLQKNFGFPVVLTPSGTFTFDARGMASGTLCVCVDPSDNPGSVDSLIVSPTNIAMGKRNQGGDCVVSQIVVQ